MDNTLSIILVIFSSSIACTTGASGLREGDYDNDEDKPKEKPYYFCDLPQRIEDKICASDKLPTLAESMEAADMAFYATVLEKYKDSHTDFSMAYDALVQVHCILKGEKRVLPIINITRADTDVDRNISMTTPFNSNNKRILPSREFTTQLMTNV
ncbi:hypothetical protein HELRODRAFT_168382 [Helobdella robusta]|uniref:Uncharacterized protein n=1 Tax=Helobdella robusta TaxID=6412 RepID=T1F0I6_HELRO|nr:hypothetical protein HELRODRAFT_168382 [Helobdella robusta]ESO09400.1 hypothetical protein HELRODRAFT_168382 [Helobdella robusta]